MYIVLGGTGHVGSAVALNLLARRELVTVVTRDPAKAGGWRDRGAQVAAADLHDAEALRRVLRAGRRAYLLNPPAPPSTDTDVEERRTIAAILAALEGSGIEQVVAASTYGARPAERCGDFNTLFELENGLRRQPIPARVIRGAYYFTNWDRLLEPARETGTLRTLFPADLEMPMVSPLDLGRAAADRLTAPIDGFGIEQMEGPRRYTPADVAATFSRVLGRDVRPAVAPRGRWRDAFLDQGFSAAAAESYARMTAASIDEGFEQSLGAVRGEVTLEAHVRALASRQTPVSE